MKIFNNREKAKLKSALSQYAKDKCEHLPCDESLQNITFSDGFESKMTKVFKRQKTAVVYRVVALCACLALILVGLGYFARPQDIPEVTPPKVETDDSFVAIENTMENISFYGNEFFIAKIIKNPKITVDYREDEPVTEHTASQTIELTPTLCTAKVIKSITTEAVTEGEKVKLFNYVFQGESSYAKNLKKGKTYLISATIEPHNQSAAVVCELVAELDGDTLLPTNSMTEIMFKDTDTLTQFLNNEHVKKMIDGDINRYYNFHYEIIKTKDKIYTYQNDKDYFMGKIKESIKPGAKKIFTTVNRVNDEFYNDLYYTDAVFTAKVVGREREIDADSFTDSEWIYHSRLVGTPALYHIEVEDNMWSFFEGKPTIKLVFYENGEQLEVGGTYLFSAIAQPFEDSAVLVESGTYTAKVNGKKLMPITESSKLNLDGLDTFKKLTDSNNFLALTLELFGGNDYPNNAFDKYIASDGDTTVTIDGLGHPESDYYKYQKIVAEAITVGSTATITKAED